MRSVLTGVLQNVYRQAISDHNGVQLFWLHTCRITFELKKMKQPENSSLLRWTNTKIIKHKETRKVRVKRKLGLRIRSAEAINLLCAWCDFRCDEESSNPSGQR